VVAVQGRASGSTQGAELDDRVQTGSDRQKQNP
jgi:hypothetical protein